MKKYLVSLYVFVGLVTTTTQVFGQNSVMDFYNLVVADYKEMMIEHGESATAPFIVRKKDVKNGFISYERPAVEGFEDMAYYIPTKGNKFVSVVTFGCGPACSASMPQFYEIEAGKLVYQTEKYLSKSTLAEIEKGLAIAKPKIKLKDSEASLSDWVEVPQKGTTILIGFMEDSAFPKKENFTVVYELVYTKANASFKLVKK